MQIGFVRPWTHGVDKLVYATAQLAGFRERAKVGGKADRRVRLNRRFQLHVQIGRRFIGIRINDWLIRQDKERISNNGRAVDGAINVRRLRLLFRREEGDFRHLSRLADGRNGVINTGIFSLHQIQLHRHVKIRTGEINDNRVGLFFYMLNCKVCSMNFGFIRQGQKEQLLRRKRMVSRFVFHYHR